MFRVLSEKLPLGLQDRMPAAFQRKALRYQPPIPRVIRVDISTVANLCYTALQGSISARRFIFSTDLRRWSDLGVGHHFVRDIRAGRSLEETEDYQMLMRLIADGRQPKGLRNRDEVLAYLARVIDVFEDIEANGMREPSPRDRGIQVCVDEGGRLCKVWAGGTHRYGLARELNLTDVPVYIRNVHASWAESAIGRDPSHPLAAIARAIQRLDVKGSLNQNQV